MGTWRRAGVGCRPAWRPCRHRPSRPPAPPLAQRSALPPPPATLPRGAPLTAWAPSAVRGCLRGVGGGVPVGEDRQAVQPAPGGDVRARQVRRRGWRPRAGVQTGRASLLASQSRQRAGHLAGTAAARRAPLLASAATCGQGGDQATPSRRCDHSACCGHFSRAASAAPAAPRLSPASSLTLEPSTPWAWPPGQRAAGSQTFLWPPRHRAGRRVSTAWARPPGGFGDTHGGFFLPALGSRRPVGVNEKKLYKFRRFCERMGLEIVNKEKKN